jgi:glyoxylase-like metal-dependent hydrolase (beta-lactamase superfamily II)
MHHHRCPTSHFGSLVKRRLILGGAGIVGVVLATLSPFFAAFVGTARPTDRTELPGGARLIADGFALLYVIPHGSSVALVDCGNDPKATAVRAELERRGLPDTAVTHIFLTHGHPDHTGCLDAFPSATVYALEAEKPLLEGHPERTSPLGRLVGSRAVSLHRFVPLVDSQPVMLEGKQVMPYAVPGHTEGSAAFAIDGVLYLGDSAGASTEGTVRGAPWVFSVDTSQNRQSLKRLAARLSAMQPTMTQVAFGHTAPLPVSALAAFRAED